MARIRAVRRLPRRPLGQGIILAVVLGLLGLGAGAWLGATRGADAEAMALVLINPLEGNPFSPDAGGDRLVSLETEAQLVTSDVVAGLVADAGEPGLTPETVLAGVSVEVPPNTQLVKITVRHPSAEVAIARAQSFAETYLAYRRARTEAAVFDRRAEVDERIREHSREVGVLARALDRAGDGSAEATVIQQKIGDLTTQMGLLRTQFAGLQTASSDPGQVVTPAGLAEPGVLDRPGLGGGVGAALGVGLALALTIARIRRDTRVTDAEDLARVDVPVAAVLPAEGGPTADDEHQLRVAVLTRGLTHPVTVLVAATHDDASHSGRVATALAAGLARARHEVVLTDLAAPVGDAAARSGASDILRGDSSPDKDLQTIAPHLWRLTEGTAAERLDDLVASPEMSALTDDLRKRADVVVLHGPALDSPRSQMLLLHADLVVVAAELGTCRSGDLQEQARRLRAADKQLVGVALVAPSRHAAAPSVPEGDHAVG